MGRFVTRAPAGPLDSPSPSGRRAVSAGQLGQGLVAEEAQYLRHQQIWRSVEGLSCDDLLGDIAQWAAMRHRSSRKAAVSLLARKEGTAS